MFGDKLLIIPQMKDVKNWLNMHWENLESIKSHLESYGVKFDVWFSEQSYMIVEN